MTSGTKPKEYYLDDAGRHPVFPLSAIVAPGDVVAEIGADEIKDTHIDWGTGAGQVSAADLPIADAGGWTAQTETEATLQEILGSNTESIKAGFDVSGGGTVSLSAASLFKWTARIIVISAGRGSHFGTSGYFDINMPTSGTLTGVGGTSDQTWTANGCTLSSWLALYYILPIGSSSSSVAANFRIASYTSDLKVPSTWLLIAVRNADGLVPAKVCNGMTLLPGESRTFGEQPTPTGAIMMWSTATAPTGWLLCDGSAVSETTYAGLFAVIGHGFGGDPGGGNFYLPNFKGISPTGVGTQTINTRDKAGPALGEVREDYIQYHFHRVYLTEGTGTTLAGYTGTVSRDPYDVIKTSPFPWSIAGEPIEGD